MQTWPALRYLNAAIVSAVFSGSASPNTTTGECPPSSMVARFMPLAASSARCLPTGIEPVNEILRTIGEAIRCSETFAGTPNTRLSTPGGTPASSKHRTSSTQPPGVSSEALRMIEQPAASAAADLARRRERREIPRRERRDHADRLGHHHLAHGRVAARDDAAIGAAAFLGEPFDDVGGGDDLALRLGEDLALLLGHDARDLVGALAQQVGGLLDDAAAVIGGLAFQTLKPFWAAASAASRSLVLACGRCASGFCGRRIDHVLAAAAIAVVPLAVDVEPELRVTWGPRLLGFLEMKGWAAAPLVPNE